MGLLDFGLTASNRRNAIGMSGALFDSNTGRIGSSGSPNVRFLRKAAEQGGFSGGVSVCVPRRTTQRIVCASRTPETRKKQERSLVRDEKLRKNAPKLGGKLRLLLILLWKHCVSWLQKLQWSQSRIRRRNHVNSLNFHAEAARCEVK